MTWSDTLSDNGIMMEEGEAAKALALGISEKTALSGGTTSVDVSGMCNSLFAPIDWGFCDAVDQVLCVIAPRFVDGNSTAYSSDIGELITVAGFTAAVYGATNGEVRLQSGGMLFDSKWIEQRKGILNLFVNAGTPVADATFTTTSLNSNTWTVTGSSVSGATTTLPDSLNAVGSTVTPTSYFRGPVEYSTNVTLDSSKRYYLYLEPVYQRADVVLSGHTATSLEVYGGTSTEHTFTVERPGLPVVIDLTSVPFANGGNTLTVKTDNTSTYVNIPFDGMLNVYNIFGGATLCAAGTLCFDPVTFGTRRCHLDATTTKVTIKFAIKCNSNQNQAVTANVYAYVYEGDDTTAMNQTTATEIEVNPGETKTYTMNVFFGTTISNKKWGLGSGKLFRVKLELMKGNPATAQDTIEEYFGYRTFSAAKHNSSDGGYGLTLNGSTTSLYGVTYHHWDRMPTTTEMDADWAIISDLKPQMIRFAYFPALHYLLDKCDQAGIVAMIEIPWMHDFHNGEWNPNNQESYRNAWRLRYQHNVTANAVAMINEFYNHPSVLFYTIGTGFGVKAYHEYYVDQAHTFITDELLPAVRAADSTRLVCLEQAGNTSAAWTDVSDILLERMSSGWGSGSISNAVSEADSWNGKNSTIPVGFMDWSYGANPSDHVEWSSASTKPSDTGLNNIVPYPEEYQAYCVEQYAASALALTWPVFNLYGTVFDYASSNVTEAGGKSGVMQTGLVTRDRSVLKDAYYFLKAMWNDEPMVYITQKRNMNKDYTPITLRIYTNCAYVKVYSSSMTLLDTIQRTSGSYVVTKSLELEEGSNVFYVTGHSTSSGEATCSDNVTVQYEDTSGTVHVVICSDNAIVNSGVVAAKVLPSTEPQSVTWTSLDTSVATIDGNGTVTVVADGTASIRATSTEDSSITKVKSIPCFIKGETQSLYYQAALKGDSTSPYTQYGLTVTNNNDGTFTIDGTLSRNGSNKFIVFPNGYSGGSSRTNSTMCTILVPPWGFPGDQLVTAEITGGTITGTHSGTPMTVTALDPTYNGIAQIELYPLSDVTNGNPVKAKLVSGSTLGISGFRFDLGYDNGTVFDNVVLKIQSFKASSGTYYNGGILESHFDPVNTVDTFGRDSGDAAFCNMYSRNANGSFTITIGNPNAGYGLTPYGRVTDTLATARYSVPVSGATIASAGDVVKFTAIMLNWPGNYVQKEETSEFSFEAWYADGSSAATLKWAYGAVGDGVDFTGGTASTTFVATKTIDSAGWKFKHMAWGGSLNATEAITFALKMELLDPTEIPPTSITAYASDRIVNSGYAAAACSPASSNQSVTWSSSNTSVATIDSSTGFITVVSDGQCTFTATSTLDNTKSGSVTVSCLKITSENMLANMAVLGSGSTVTVSGITTTNNGDGTFTLDGTLSTANATTTHIIPTNTSKDPIVSFFPKGGITGDVIVWMEHLSGTVTNISGFTGYDFGIRFYDESNTALSSYNLDYEEKPTSGGNKQSVLITGSTAGVRRADILVKRASGSVFDSYRIRLGLKKFSSQGNVYTGGLIEQYLPALCSFTSIGSRNIPGSRNPDGSLYIRWRTSLNAFSNGTQGCVKLTNGMVEYGNVSSIPNTDVIASSGTYKFKVKFLDSCTFDSSAGSAAELSFVVLGSDRTQLATLQHISQNAYTSTFDNNNEAEITFTSNMNITCVYISYSGVKLTNYLFFAVSLTAATTT